MKFKPMTSKELNEFGQTFATGFAAGIEKSKRRMGMGMDNKCKGCGATSNLEYNAGICYLCGHDNKGEEE